MTTLKRLLFSFAVIAALAGSIFYFNPLWVSDLSIRFHLYRQHVRSEYVQVDGYSIHYFEASPPRIHGKIVPPDTPLVLVHGLGARAEDWSPLIPSLAAHGFHVYALDLLGYGRSPRPDVDFSIHLQEQIVTDFMRSLHLNHADVAGWSMGGWIALKLAADHPELVDRLVVYDSAGVYFKPTFDASLFTPNDSAGLTRLMKMLTPNPRPLPDFVQRAAIRKLQSNAWIIDRSVTSMTTGHDLLNFHLQKLDIPVLIVWGKQDVLIPIASAEVMHQAIAGSSLVLIDGCGHLAPAECSRPVLRATLQFLRANPPLTGVEQTIPAR